MIITKPVHPTGSYGKVREAIDSQTLRRVAIKILKKRQLRKIKVSCSLVSYNILKEREREKPTKSINQSLLFTFCPAGLDTVVPSSGELPLPPSMCVYVCVYLLQLHCMWPHRKDIMGCEDLKNFFRSASMTPQDRHFPYLN